MKLRATAIVVFSILSCAVLSGCGIASSVEETASPVVPVAPGTTSVGHLQGRVYGGGLPITGAKIFLYAAANTATAGASTAYGITTTGTVGSRSNSLLNSGTTNVTKDTVATDITFGDNYVLTDTNGNFDISGDYTCAGGTQLYLFSLGGNPGASTGINSAASLLTALPNCPTGGGSVAGLVGFIYSNEVSTIAMAYAVAGFAHDAVHIGAPNNILAQTGITNAFLNASNLYDIGSSATGHDARISSGNVIRPNATVNTLANILQSCVNTYDSSTTLPGGISSACGTLFGANGSESDAKTTAGTTSTAATDETATAAIFIAQHPGRNVDAAKPTASLYTDAITSASAYSPNLTTAPNDFTVQLLFSGGGMVSTSAGSGSYYTSPRSLAIDAAGDAWVAGIVSSVVSAFSPLGVPLSSTGYTTGADAHSVAIDASGYAWVTVQGTGSAATSKVYELYATNTGAIAGTVAGSYASGGIEPTDAELDASGNVWITNLINSAESAYGDLVELSSTGASLGTYNSTATANNGNAASNELYKPAGVGIAPSGLVWSVDGAAANTYISIFTNKDASSVYEGPFTEGPLSGSIAFDTSGDGWITEASEYVEKLTPGYAKTRYTLPAQYYEDNPEAISADGNSNMWVTDFDNGVVYELSNTGTILSPTYGYPTPGNSGYSGTPTVAYNDDSIAVDGSGDVWYSTATTSTNYLGEIIGVATPVATPIAYGLKNSQLGSRP